MPFPSFLGYSKLKAAKHTLKKRKVKLDAGGRLALLPVGTHEISIKQSREPRCAPKVVDINLLLFTLVGYLNRFSLSVRRHGVSVI